MPSAADLHQSLAETKIANPGAYAFLAPRAYVADGYTLQTGDRRNTGMLEQS
jgi:hypothetical protein